MTYRAVLFDLDGTLLDTLTDLADATNRALGSLGFPEHPRESFRYFVGDGVEALVGARYPETAATGLHRPNVSAGCVMSTAGVGRPQRNLILEFPSYWMRWPRSMPMAVLSNKPDEFTGLCVARLLPQWHFAAVLGAGPRLPKKPDPAAALEIACRLGVTPAEMVYLGDTSTDMQTATAAEMFPVGVLWGFRPAAELTASGAQLLLQRPPDLLRIIAH